MSNGTIYLDYNATTPVAAGALEAMLPWLQASFGNPSSQHEYGRVASQATEGARQEIADLLSCSKSEVVFTSGATEANNLALKGAVLSAPTGRDRVLVAATEHKSVLDTTAWLERQGIKVEVIPVRRDGVVDLNALAGAVGSDVALVSVMLANNETGVISPIAEVAELARGVGALTHTDATQAAGKVAVDVRALSVDLASISSHKLYGPQGVGALYVKRRTALAPLLHGGGHERGLRSGTLNVPGIIGFGAAAALVSKQIDVEAHRVRTLVAQLLSELTRLVHSVQPVAVDPRAGIEPDVLPNTLNVRFPGVDAEAIIANAPNIAVSTGSACSSLVPAPSHVLLAMLGDAGAAAECIRFSLGRPTTEAEVMRAASEIGQAVQRLYGLDAPEAAWC